MNVHAAPLLLALLLACGLQAKPERSAAAVAAFKRQQPCPVTGASRGSCAGYVVDHVVPLCAGGADHPTNMQWQTLADSKAKDRDEVRACRALKSEPRR